MANLKRIKDRINSISNTKKITSAMKTVAVTKVKKCEAAVLASRPFAEELEDLISKLFEYSEKNADIGLPKIAEKRDIKNEGILIITSDKGLAGAYNVNISKFTLNEIEKIQSEGKNVKLFIAGQKGITFFSRREKDKGFKILKTYPCSPECGNKVHASIIAEDLTEAFLNENIDSIRIITTKFKNLMSSLPEKRDILPAGNLQTKDDKIFNEDFEFEPGIETILGKLLPYYIAAEIYEALLEASASELAARMTAMSAATDNAEEMISKLTTDYNKVRQQLITGEITEVVAGADALN